MSEEQLKAFLEVVKADAGLQEKLNAAEDADAVVAIAKEVGFMVSADELQRAQAVGEELSDEELERVSGGGTWLCTALLLCPVEIALSVAIKGADDVRGIKELCVDR
jgi:predicted ribosomally synthesized peptide with nif11-like leader